MLANVVLVSEDAGGRGRGPGPLERRSSRQLDRAQGRPCSDKLDLLARGEEATAQHGADGRHPRGQGLRRARPTSQAKRHRRRCGGPAVAYAKSKVGNAYVYGAAGPNAFDCSGLTMAAWSQAGVSLPHSSSAQYSSGRHISESELQPGDLVFYYSPISHVGMYIGNGQIVNALNPGAGVADLRSARHAVRRCGAPGG